VTEAEVRLTGGTLNSVVRVGETVRRPVGPWTATIHALLRHIRSRGFALAPEPLGFDDQGREILSFIPGQTVGWSLPWPDLVRNDDLLEEVGATTALYHRVVTDFRPTALIPWQSGSARLGPEELICHHDLAPYNVVLADGHLRGVIDWDLAGPGSILSELAFVAWQWVPLHGPMVTRLLGWSEPPDRARRLNLLLDAYGLDDRSGFIDQVKSRITYNRHLMVHKAEEGHAAYESLVQQGHVAGMDEALAYLSENGPLLQDRL
jgi:Phosphotransferase enzyme family